MQSVIQEIAYRQSVIEVALNWYKRWLSPIFGDSCRFSPTCSEFAAQAVVEYGWWRGGMLAVKRVLRCHPFGSSGYDPVPSCSHREQLRP